MPAKDPRIQALREQLEKNPRDTQNRLSLVKILDAKGNYSKSLEHLEIILSQKPHHKNAQNLKAQIEEKLAVAGEGTTTSPTISTNTYLNGAAADDTEQREVRITGKTDDETLDWDMCDM